MTRQFRSWALFVAVAVVTPFAGSVASAQQATRYLPKNTGMVFQFDLKRIFDAKVMSNNKNAVDAIKDFLRGKMEGNEQFVKVQKALEFDLFRDLDRVTLGVSPGKNPENVCIVIEGAFKPARIKKVAGQFPNFIKATAIGNTPVYEMSNPTNAETLYIGVANKKTLIASKVKADLAAALNRQVPMVPAQTKALLKSINSKACIGMLMTRKYLDEAMNNAPPQAAMAKRYVEQLKGVTVEMVLSTDLKFRMGAEATNAQNAKFLRRDLENGLDLMKTLLANQALNNPALQPIVDIVDTLKVGSQGTTLSVRGQVSGEIIEQGMKMIQPFLGP
ncbi:MAG: hypothetical protein ACFCD0_10600 [Gemmataceae bacterium]